METLLLSLISFLLAAIVGLLGAIWAMVKRRFDKMDGIYAELKVDVDVISDTVLRHEAEIKHLKQARQ